MAIDPQLADQAAEILLFGTGTGHEKLRLGTRRDDALHRPQKKDVPLDRFQRARRTHDGKPARRQDRRDFGRRGHINSRVDHVDHLGGQRRSAQEFRFDALADGNNSPPPLAG